jgi:hypothetical protein
MPLGATLPSDKDMPKDRIFGREEEERASPYFAEFRHSRSLDFGELDGF